MRSSMHHCHQPPATCHPHTDGGCAPVPHEHCGSPHKRSAHQSNQYGSWIDQLPLPGWLKSLLKDSMQDSHVPDSCHSQPPARQECLPSESGAAKTIHNFQKSVLGGERITAKQMDQMARTGYITKKDGSTVRVSPEVQDAAKRFMANGGELFKKMESATDGKHDGELGVGDYGEAIKDGTISRRSGRREIVATGNDHAMPSALGAAKTINSFQNSTLCGEKISIEQMDQMARTGYITTNDGKTIRVPRDVQEAAQRFMANGAELFKAMESATDGKHDGRLGSGDYFKALKNGTLFCFDQKSMDSVPQCESMLPCASYAAKTIHDFQNAELGGKRISIDEMQQIGTTGYLTKDGKTIRVSPEVQAAAQRFMANNAELFKHVESATDGKHDGQLGAGDYYQALRKGILFQQDDAADCVFNHGEYALPSSSGAAKTIKDFQNCELDGQNLSIQEMDQIARTGYLTKNGKTMEVSPEVQAAAMRFMCNNGELFRKIESATDGRHDGQLGAGDYHEAVRKGMISPSPGKCETMSICDEYALPSASGAAKTINDFQKEKMGGDKISIGQMDEIARTGYLTHNGRTIAVSPEVQAAAQRFMANNAELFRNMESATDGRHDGRLGVGDYREAIKDGTISAHDPASDICMRNPVCRLPSASGAAKTINDFQKEEMGGDKISIGQMDEIARTGYLTHNGKTIAVSPEVQAAAQRFMANNAELFRNMESATDGRHDGRLGVGDYREAIKDGTISACSGTPWMPPPAHSECTLPSASGAAKTINDFQKEEMGGDKLDKWQMMQMATTGYLTHNGKTIEVSPEVQAAAQRFMANDGELFDDMESATNGQHDGKLGVGDYNEAIKDGTIIRVA